MEMERGGTGQKCVPFCSAALVAVCAVSKNRAPCLMACRRKEEAQLSDVVGIGTSEDFC